MSQEMDFLDFEMPSAPAPVLVPAYLLKNYWWAYVHPRAVQVFERQWLVNAILWGNFAALRDAALDALGRMIDGKTLQVACVYGDFSLRLAERIAPSGALDVVDVLPIQLENLRRKLPVDTRVNTHLRDSSNLQFADGGYDQTVLFFLLHEQPARVRRATLCEALRVTRHGGKVVLVDYHQPRQFHPLRYLFRPLLHWLEPFALELWHYDIAHWLPEHVRPEQIRKKLLFGGLYQMLVITA